MPTPAQIKEIITTARSDEAVQSFIDDAKLIVGDIYADQLPRQRAIVKWIAAHLIASTDQDGIRASEKLGDASDTFARANLGIFLRGTTYGQQALLLDEDDLLIAGKNRVTIEVI